VDNLYIFSIGGSGAKCLESLVHLCAVGLGPKEVHPVLIDPDQENGNLDRTSSLILLYEKIREKLKNPEEGSFFYTDIKKLIYWNPLSKKVQKKEDENYSDKSKNLEDVIGYTTINQEEKLLSELLLKKDQRKLNLKFGFRGVPSIGSVVLHQIKKQDFYKETLHNLKSNESNKGFVFASIFGGTGASGYPVITQLLKLQDIKNKIGGVILMPYFYLKSPHNIDETIKPDSSTFILNTIGAIPFYIRDIKSDTNYVIGDMETEPIPKYSLGGREQLNDSHFIELIAALASLSFSKHGDNLNRYSALKVSTPITDGSKDFSISLNDLPIDKNGKHLLRKFGLFVNSFRVIFKSVNENELDEVLFLLGWLNSKLKISKNQMNETKKDLKDIYAYLEKFIIWNRQMSQNTPSLKLFHEEFEFQHILLSAESTLEGKLEDELDRYYLKYCDTQKTSISQKILSTMNAGINKYLLNNK